MAESIKVSINHPIQRNIKETRTILSVEVVGKEDSVDGVT